MEQIQTGRHDAAGHDTPAGAFHSLRVNFNAAFLNEDFSAAADYCRRAESVPDLSMPEREELSRFFLMLGKVDDALRQIDLVLEARPEEHALARKKAEILRLNNDHQACRSFLDERLDRYPQNIGYYAELLMLADSVNDADAREYILEKAKANGLELSPLLPQEQPPVKPDVLNESAEIFQDADLLAFISLFAGRENCHARQWVGEEDKYGYTLVNEPVNIQLVRNHLLGIHTLGIYQLDLSNKVKWIMFDLDADKSYLNDFHDQDVRSWIDAGLKKAATQLKDILAAYQIHANLEFSGFKGYHLWVLLEEKISAAFARVFAQRVAAQINLEGLPIHVEIFPKQTRVAPSSYGNLVKLPYGLHRLSGLPSSMLAEDGSLIPFTDFIHAPRLTSNQLFISALYSLDPDFNIKNGIAAQLEADVKTGPTELGSPLPDPETDPEWLCIKQNCHALWTVDNLIKTRSILTNEQRNVLKFTAGYLKQGPAIVNSLLRKCTNLDPADLMKSGFKGNSISCAKVRSYLEDSINPSLCACDFSLAPGMYSTPILHLRKLSNGAAATIQWNELKLKDLIASYLKLKKDVSESQETLDQKEKQIMAAFDDIGVEEIATPWGTLRKTTEAGNVRLSLELK